jgi:DNA (cytosine-5)-methyltransferase 1
MRELSLFTGAGGGILGTLLMGWTPVGYVEFNDYCQRVLAQRIEDGHIERAPIFGDIRAFVREGYAASYQGMVDLITAGFPCQPFSVAGKQAAADDPRNMWPATAEVLRIVRPRFALLENVPGLLAGSHGYFGEVLRELATLGYDVRWGVLSAADAGAPHLRKRLWIRCEFADAECRELRDEQGRGGGEGRKRATEPVHYGVNGSLADPDGEQAERIAEPRQKRDPWHTEPDVGRVANGVAKKLDIP